MLIGFIVLSALIILILIISYSVSKSIFYCMVLTNDFDFQKNINIFKNSSKNVDTRSEITKNILYFENKSHLFKEFYIKNLVSFLVLLLIMINKNKK